MGGPLTLARSRMIRATGNDDPGNTNARFVPDQLESYVLRARDLTDDLHNGAFSLATALHAMTDALAVLLRLSLPTGL